MIFLSPYHHPWLAKSTSNTNLPIISKSGGTTKSRVTYILSSFGYASHVFVNSLICKEYRLFRFSISRRG